MPAKNSVKIYVENGFYHLYNRGVEKRNIFMDQQDFGVFMSYLKTYLLPKDLESLKKISISPEASYKERQKAEKQIALKNFSGDVELLAYSLLPNHFHFLIKQHKQDAIDRFMNALATRYVSYFNRRYKRIGPLFQGVYKAVSINNDRQLLHLSRYIHLNPVNYLHLPFARWPEIVWPHSLPNYLGIQQSDWVNSECILSYFHKDTPNFSYQNFVASYSDETEIAPLALDFEDS